ncbi:MAG: hypothetical protein ACAI25_19085 [Planctomycetota bacterium]
MLGVMSREKGGAVGYAALVTLAAGGLVGALVLGGLGLYAYFAAADQDVRNTAQGHALVASLESALALWSFGVLALLVSIVAFTVLLKGLADDVSQARRGPVGPSGPT